MKRIAFALPPKNSSKNGNVILFALIASVVVVVGLLGTATRSRYAGRSIARESLARNALDAAEAGKDIILENLNTQHPYLLVVNNNQWDDPPTYSTLCSTLSSETPHKVELLVRQPVSNLPSIFSMGILFLVEPLTCE